MNYITRLEETILIAIWKLKDNAYGVTINREVSEITCKDYTMGSLYFTLDQLYKKDLVKKEKSEPTPERGGRSRVFYTLSERGVEALANVRALQSSIWNTIPERAFIKSDE